MSPSQAIQNDRGASAATDEGHLEVIGLDAEQLDAVRRQGFISRETRGRLTIFKLRFLLHGKQRVKYLGTDEQRVAAIQAALNKLQEGRVLDRRLRDLNQQARERLKESKQRLLPLMAGSGWRFHGRVIRRMRKKTRAMFNSGQAT